MQMIPNQSVNAVWRDRWTTPTLRQLLAGLPAQRRRSAERLIEQVTHLPGVTQSLIWYGTSWKWTLQFTLTAERREEGEALCYVVPGDERATAHVPLTEEFVATLPMRRLSKFVRDGVRSAKRVVESSWASWSVETDSDVKLVGDLIARKHRFATSAPKISASA